MLDIKKVKEEAEQEVLKEQTEAAKNRIKDQMRRVRKAKTAWDNEKRALDDLLTTVAEGN